MKHFNLGMAGIAIAALSCTSMSGMGAGGAHGSAGGLGSGGSSGLSASCGSDFGTSASAMKVESFLAATAAFTSTANDLSMQLHQTCAQMGNELGIPPGELAPSGDNPQQVVCERVARQIHDEMVALRQARSGARIEVVASPPRCEVSMDAYADCAGHCDATIDPGHAEVHCEGGEIRGACSGQCTGHCYVDAHGQCDGTCQGTCEGTCSARDAHGACNGACRGTCNGTCQMRATGSCGGECSGGCSVAMTQPRCTGHVQPPQMSAECRASCDARINAQAQCHPGEAQVTIAGGLSGDTQARAERLRVAIHHGFGTIALIHQKLELLSGSAQGMVDTGGQLPSAVGDLGAGAVNAVRCIGESAAALPRASASISVSVQVSASVTGSASAG